jgi:hypothetical protein
LAFAPALGAPAYGQISLSISDDAKQQLPYTEEFKVDSVTIAPDLTVRTHETTYIQAKDSHHRRLEMTISTPSPGKGEQSIQGSITDPENGTRTEWDTRSKRAVVAEWPAMERRYGCWQTDEGRPRISFGFRPSPDVNLPTRNDQVADPAKSEPVLAAQGVGPIHEDLGTASIQGVEARGERWSWPSSGDDSTNLQHAFLSTERWIATGSGLLVKELVEYPRKPGFTKTYSQDLVKLVLAEPDAARFEPPVDYEIVRRKMHEVPCGRASRPLP